MNNEPAVHSCTGLLKVMRIYHSIRNLLLADDGVLLATVQVDLRHASEHFTAECEVGPRL